MVIPNTYPSLSNIVHTDFELGRVMCTVAATDPGITEHNAPSPMWGRCWSGEGIAMGGGGGVGPWHKAVWGVLRRRG